MYVWRLPFVSFAALVTGTALSFVILFLLRARASARNVVLKAVLLACAVASVGISPVFVYLIAARELKFLAVAGIWRHYGPVVYLAPGLAAAFCAGLAHSLIPPRIGARSPVGWRLLFLSVIAIFALLNLANWCSPGWCERFGFPFPYSWWSDGIMIMNGVNLTAGVSRLALFGNGILLVVVLSAIVRGYKRATSLIAWTPPN